MNGVLKGFDQVPPNFQILVKLCSMLRSDYSTIEDISELVRLDSALAAGLVRLSNSAYYGSMVSATTLDEAIGRVGLGEVVKMVALISNTTFLTHPLSAYEIEPEVVWEESLASAILMEFFAHEMNEDPGHAYLTGLLARIGMYPISRMLTRIKPTVKCASDLPFMKQASWERREIGLDHARVGSLLLEKWGFGEEVYHPVSNQLHPFLASHKKKMACMLHLSRQCIPVMLDPQNFAFSELKLPTPVLLTCEIGRDELELLVPRAVAWYRSTVEMVAGELMAV